MKTLFLFLIILLSCTTKHPKEITKTTDDSIKRDFNTIIKEINKNELIDSLVFDSVKINNSIPLKLKEIELLNKLGLPDSVIKENGWSCGNYLNESDSLTVYYYGLTRFIVSKGEALLHKFIPDDKLTFGTSDFMISGKTNESKLKLRFPKSYNNMLYRIENEKNFEKRRMKVGMIKNPIGPDDNGFIFYFENNVLIRVELWWFIC